MRNQIATVLLGVTLSLASAGTSYGMSSLVSMSKDPVWPTTPTPDTTIVYNVTTVARAGSGLLEVTLSAGAMPPGVTVTFNPSVLRFTGNAVTSQTAAMTVTCNGLIPIDCYPFTLTGTAQRETITTTNKVLYSPDLLATRLPTLYLDKVTSASLHLRGLGASGKTYQIESSPSLTNPTWTPVGSSTADANGRFIFFPSKAVGPTAVFYRAVTTGNEAQ